jgi:lysophospholipase L1-like esterase
MKLLSLLTLAASLASGQVVNIPSDTRVSDLPEMVNANVSYVLNSTMPARTACLFGDSITANNGVPGGRRRTANGYWDWAQALSGNRFRLLCNAGVSGNTTAQMLARLATDVIPFHAKYVVVLGGINDLRSGTDVTSATTIANLASIAAQLLDDGSTVILATIPPYTAANGNSSTQAAKWTTINASIRQTALSTPNVYFVDFAAAYLDATNAAPYPLPTPVTATSDGLHPASMGAYLMGRLLAALLITLVAPVPDQPIWNNDPANYVVNGLLTGSAGTSSGSPTGTLPTSWKIENTATTCDSTQMARPDGFGYWIQLAVVATNHRDYCRLNQSLSTLPAAGSVVYLEAEIQSIGAADEIWLVATFLDATFAAKGTVEWGGNTFTNGLDIGTVVLRSDNFTVLSGTAHGTVVISALGTQTLKIGRIRIVKAQ